MYISSHPEVYLEQTFNIGVFILKLWSILEVDFLNFWIYVQPQKDIRSRFPKVIIFFQAQKYTWSTSFQKIPRSINEVLLKYKQSTFLFYSVFILHFYFFLEVHLKHTSIGLQGSEV